MKLRTILLALGAILTTGISVHADPVRVVLLGGQSNMAGRGVFEELDPALKERIIKASERVEVSSDGRPAQPLSFQKPGQHAKGFGPELFIGLTFAEADPKREFLLIKTAVGGTSLYGAWNPDWTQEKSNASELDAERKKLKLFSDHLASIRTNLKALDEQEKSFEIIGMAWMQGEKDIRLELSAVSYEANLTDLIAAYRKELEVPNLPFVIGQVNSPLRGNKDYQPGPKTVRAAMAKVALTVPHAAMIPTSTDPSWPDFPKRDDDVHYNTEGQKRLGIAFATALAKLIN